MKPNALFLSHGGGPMPLLGDPDHQEMVACLDMLSRQLPRPSAIIVVSAHWEESVATITSSGHPSLIYDYYGFPPESYEVRYPCPGDPGLAQKVRDLLVAGGMEARVDAQRGIDHGVFVPLKILYPDAGIPCIELSLVRGLDPATHLRMGQILSGIEDPGVLIIGSGFSFHNMEAFFASETASSRTMNEDFEHWLIDTCTNPQLSEAERRERFIHWEQAPYARYCHPREEHLIPLLVCYGAASAPARSHHEIRILNKQSSLYVW